MTNYDPIRDANEGMPKKARIESLPYAPKRRVFPPKSMLVPIRDEEVQELWQRSQNPLRRGAAELPEEPVPDQTDMVATHYNMRQEVGVEERENSPIIGLKRFNNWVKSALIDMWSLRTDGGRRVLDLGCGKGGDLKKWDRKRPTYMVMIDIAEVSVEQARTRYQQGGFNWPAVFFAFDCFSEPLDAHVPEDALAPLFDNVSLQFCMHYGWDSETHARTMLENIARWLKPGATVVGTIPDAETLYARLDALPDTGDVSFGNSKYRVEFESRERPTSGFGHKYTFWLEDAVDCVPEYVIEWDHLVQLASEYGLEPVYRARFDQVLMDGFAKPSLRTLLERMRVINVQLAQETGEVEPDMSTDMWDVCTLYLAFCFKKVP